MKQARFRKTNIMCFLFDVEYTHPTESKKKKYVSHDEIF